MHFFEEVTLEGQQITANDWVGAFDGDTCVGTRKWDTSGCGSGVCDVPVFGMSTGDIPTFKIFRASDLTYYDAYASEEVPWANFGAAIIDKKSLSTLTVGCNNELSNPLFHGEISAIYEYFNYSYSF